MSLYFTGVRLTNFLCYRGEHEVELGPGIFALTAERDGDPRRSNAVGKSAFLWSLRFVLTGDHPRRTEDDWITDGEQEGSVDGELSNGMTIFRWRKRGGSTQVKVVVPERDPAFEDGRMLELLGDQAQAAIDRIVGFSPREQKTTWWCEQGETDVFINGESSDATADIVRWCGVEPVRRACARVAAELRDLVTERDQQATIREDARAQLLRALGLVGMTLVDDDMIEAQETQAQRLLVEAETTIGLLEGARIGDAASKERSRERVRLEERFRKYEEYATAERDAAQRLAALVVDDKLAAQLTADEQRLKLEANKAQDVVREKSKLARGEFDGVCPVGGIQCPVKGQLNSDAACAHLLLSAAKESHQKVLATLGTAATAAQEAREKVEARAELKSDIEYARQRMHDLKAERDAFLALEEVEETGVAADLEKKLAEMRTQVDVIKRRIYDANQLHQRIASTQTKDEELAPKITARREALQILGPSGAQRRLVEGFLLRVGSSSNEDLVAAGIDLRVLFHWQRELKDPADACSQCGEPFPSSRKVKTCLSCAAPRGQKIEQKFRCEVTPKSGGMDALAGIGVRFSAGAWLRVRRASAWSVACLDEPLAAVDAHNRELVGRHLAHMLGRHYGIEQAFVSAHDQALLDSLPRRILVKGSENGSTLEVVG